MTANIKAVTMCMGYQQITDLSSATGLTVPTTTPFGNNYKPVLAVIVSESADVRWRDDGTAPTASVGMPLATGVMLQYDGDLSKIKFIQQSSGAKLNVSYYA